ERQEVALQDLVGTTGTGSRRAIGRPEEHVAGVVDVTRHKVAGIALERDVAAVRVNGCIGGAIVTLDAAAAGADARDGPRLEILDKHVVAGIGVARYEVARGTSEGDVTTVRANCGGEGVTVPLHAGRAGADARDSPRLQVLDEDIIDAIGVACYQID